jgi:hypothetical protein
MKTRTIKTHFDHLSINHCFQEVVMKLLCRSLLPTFVLCASLFLTTAATHGQTSIVLQGTVTDRNTGVVIVGASVLASCGSTFTDANGSYSLNAEQLCHNASGVVRFQATGYFQPPASQYTITASPTILNATLLPGGTLLQGVVTDASTQASIVGAMVSFCAGQGGPSCSFGSGSTTTDSNGQYAFDSSQFNESAANGFPVRGISATGAGYFNYSIGGNPLLTVNPPFPGTYNFAMSSTGITRSITIATNPAGLNITVDGVALVSPQLFNWTPSSAHTIATSTPQVPAVGTRYSFYGLERRRSDLAHHHSA